MATSSAVVAAGFIGVVLLIFGLPIHYDSDLSPKTRRLGKILIIVGCFHLVPAFLHIWTSILFG